MQQRFSRLPALQTTGTVVGVVRNWIRVESAAGQTWDLQILPTAKCKVTGKAKPDFLGPGYCIHFSAEVNRRGMVEEKVAKLSVFTPSTFQQLGAVPDSGFGASFGMGLGPKAGGEKKKAAKDARPAFGEDAGAATGAGHAARGRKASGEKAAGKAGTGEMYDIRGEIVRVTNGRLNLRVPNTYFRPLLRVEVAEDADIDVELDQHMAYTLARKGDKVSVRGRQGFPGAGNRGYAENLDITLSDPLGAPERETRRHAPKGAKGKRTAEAEKSAEGKAGKKEDDWLAPKGKKGHAGKDEALDEKKPASSDDDAAEKPAKKKTKRPKKTDDGDGT